MKKSLTIIAIVLLVATTTFAQQQVGLSYTQEYQWHGFRLYDSGYVHPGVSTSIRGVDIGVIAHADDAELDDFKYWDTSISRILASVAGFDLRAGYNYILMPNGVDVQEASITASMPGTISPRCTYAYILPDLADTEGQLYVIGLDVTLTPFEPNGITALVSVDVTYNDGVNPFGGQEVKDWTHATAGIVVDVPMQGFVLRPGVYYQHSFEPDALQCKRNEFWYGVGVQYRY